MLNEKIRKSANLSSVITSTAEIELEVKRNGFYSTYCDSIFENIMDHDALMSEIQLMAAHINLQVTFNADESICIFERC